MDERRINTNRIEWIDVAKGLTILLVIIGHSSIPDILRGIIFSFHMPLFFILSSMTFHQSHDNNDFIKNTEKAAKHLLLPALGIYFLNTLVLFVRRFSELTTFDAIYKKEYLANIITTLIAGSGVELTIGTTTINRFGIPWFLFALFFSRTLFDYLLYKIQRKTILYPVIIGSSVIGVCSGMIQWLPFSFDIALAIQPLLLFGIYLKANNDRLSTKTCIISLFVWLGLFVAIYLISGNYLELTRRRYTAYPLCFLCAIAGSVFVCCISQFLTKLNKLSIPIQFLGKNTLIMLWVHYFDRYFSFAYKITENRYINTMLRILIDIFVFSIIMHFITIIHEKRDGMKLLKKL